MNKLAFILVIFALLASNLACRTLLPGSSSDATPGQYETLCRESVTGLRSLTAGLKIPDYFRQQNPVKQGGEFDPNRYFDVLTHLRMQAGYTLDYVYNFDGLGGYPLLYARPVDEKPFQNTDEFTMAKPDPFLTAVETDDTPEGYLQFSLLALLGGRFYQYWHSGYNDSQILCGSNDIERIIKENTQADFGIPLNTTQKTRARAISQPGPVVEVSADKVTVKMVIFTNWGGFIRRTYTLNHAFPHTILDMQNETLVEYNCGVMF